MSEFADLGEFVGGFLKALLGGSWRLRREVQGNLAQLAFLQGGMRASVARIAAGLGTLADLDEIARQLRETQDATDAAYKWLSQNQLRFSRAFSAHYASQIDQVIYRKMGPGALRMQLRRMVESGDLSVASANGAIEQIDAFNDMLRFIR